MEDKKNVKPEAAKETTAEKKVEAQAEPVKPKTVVELQGALREGVNRLDIALHADQQVRSKQAETYEETAKHFGVGSVSEEAAAIRATLDAIVALRG